jgi:MFS transporter, FSR family, fosmidomycin resistance protein
VRPARRARAFSIFYTGTIGSGAIAPIVYGFVGDALGLSATLAMIAGIVLVTMPLAWALRPALATAR